ncbi:MAG TPA: phosphoribosylformylglycinamidine synthase subunit PurS [Thermoanaerobaculia bacterium]
MKLQITVIPRAGILDPQGKAIAAALDRLGYAGVHNVRAGKVFRLEIDAEGPEAARETGAAMAQRLLANPVIEDFEVEVVD